jgi:hypothetical protein
MDNITCQKLKIIISTYGPSVLDNAGKLKSLLFDEMPGNRREINLLVHAVISGAVRKIIQLKGKPHRQYRCL